MEWYDIILMIISIVIIILSLLQGGKSEGASGAITGGGLNVFATKTKERGSELVITISTMVLGIVFLTLCLIISALS